MAWEELGIGGRPPKTRPSERSCSGTSREGGELDPTKAVLDVYYFAGLEVWE